MTLEKRYFHDRHRLNQEFPLCVTVISFEYKPEKKFTLFFCPDQKSHEFFDAKQNVLHPVDKRPMMKWMMVPTASEKIFSYFVVIGVIFDRNFIIKLSSLE